MPVSTDQQHGAPLSAAEFECLMLLVHLQLKEYVQREKGGPVEKFNDLGVVGMQGSKGTVQYMESRMSSTHPLRDARAGLCCSWSPVNAHCTHQFCIEALGPKWAFLDTEGTVYDRFEPDVIARAMLVIQTKTHLQVRCPACDHDANFNLWPEHVRSRHPDMTGALRNFGFMPPATPNPGQPPSSNDPWSEWITTPSTLSTFKQRCFKKINGPQAEPDADWMCLFPHPHIMLKPAAVAPGDDPRPFYARAPMTVPYVDPHHLQRRENASGRGGEAAAGAASETANVPHPPMVQLPQFVPLTDAVGTGGDAARKLSTIGSRPTAVALILDWCLEASKAVVHACNKGGTWRHGQPPLHVEARLDDVYYDSRKEAVIVAVLPSLVPAEPEAHARAVTAQRLAVGGLVKQMIGLLAPVVFTPEETAVIIAGKQDEAQPQPHVAPAAREPKGTAISGIPEALALRRAFLAASKASFEKSKITADDMIVRLHEQREVLRDALEGPPAGRPRIPLLSMDSRMFVGLRDVVCTAVADGMLQAARVPAFGGAARPSDAATWAAEHDDDDPRVDGKLHVQHVAGDAPLPGMGGSAGWTFAVGWRVLRFGPETLRCVLKWAEALLVPPSPSDASGDDAEWVLRKAALLREALEANPGFEPAAASLAILKAFHPQHFAASEAGSSVSSRTSSAPTTPRRRMPVVAWADVLATAAEAPATAAAGERRSDSPSDSSASGEYQPNQVPSSGSEAGSSATGTAVSVVPTATTAVQRDALALLTRPMTMSLMWCEQCQELVPLLERSLHQRRHQVFIHELAPALERMLSDSRSSVSQRVQELSRRYEVQVRVVGEEEPAGGRGGAGRVIEVSGHEATDSAAAILSELLAARFTHRPYAAPRTQPL